jgi:NADPH2:quinone reductase
VVEAIGGEVAGVKPGERVYVAGTADPARGTYAEQTLCEAAQVHPLPEAVSFAQGAAINIPYATAYRALFQRAHAAPAESVLVHGATGGVGTAALQLARAHGMTVIGTGGTEAGRRLVLEQGAHHALDHHAPDFGERLQAITGGRGVDVILEMLANVNLGKDLGLLAPGGRVVVIGSRGAVEINPREAMARDAAILGMVLPNTSPADLKQIHAALVAGLSAGTLRPVVAEEVPLADAPRAHEAVMAPGHLGKIVLVP